MKRVLLGRGALSAVAVLALLSIPAVAGANDKAQGCAKGLAPESKLIYDASAQSVGSGANIRTTVTAQTKSLVMAGKVSRTTARGAAESAGKCLELLAN